MSSVSFSSLPSASSVSSGDEFLVVQGGATKRAVATKITVPAALGSWLGGSSGEVARTLASKLSDAVSVKDFGAVGNGVQDDSAAFLAAAAAWRLTGIPPFLPAGATFRLARPCYTAFDCAFINLGARVIGFQVPTVSRKDYTREFDVYCDYTHGSDGYSGLSPERPKRTLDAAIALLTTGKSLGLARGVIWPSTHVTLTVSGTTIGAYGSGARPQVRSSYGISVGDSGWSVVSGTEYRHAIPVSATSAWYYPSNSITPTTLTSGTAGSLTSGQWAYNSGTGYLHVNVGGNPNAYAFEAANSAAPINAPNLTGLTLLDIDLRHGANNCLQVSNTSAVVSKRSLFGWSGDDNINYSSVGPGTAHYYGQCQFLFAGPNGDGVSMHGAAGTLGGGVIEDCYFDSPGKDAISNAEGQKWDYINNFFKNSQITIYDDASYTNNGLHRLIGNITIGNHSGADVAAWYHISVTASHSATNVKMYNNTLYLAASPLALQRSIYMGGATVDAKNNLIEGSFQLGPYQGGGTVTWDYNNVHGTGGYVTLAPGAHDKAVDPLFTDPANSDFRLGAGSGCLAAGIAVSGVIDNFTGAAPNMGAL